MALQYNAPNGTLSSVDAGNQSKQINTTAWIKQAIINALPDQFFMPFADVTNMPTNYGKTVSRYEYVLMLDDKNVNDQGIDANGVVVKDGNLYGSSRDVGKITGKLPVIGEMGGVRNRVGFSRILKTGSLHNFGFFYEWSEDSLQFDTDTQLGSILANEAIKGASQVTEHILMLDLLSAPSNIMYAGNATAVNELTGEETDTTKVSFISYDNLTRANQILNENRCKAGISMLTGSTNTDTRTIPTSRVAFTTPDVVRGLEKLTNSFGDAAFIPVEKYGSQTKPMNGEVGAINRFRVIEVTDMLRWNGAGAAVSKGSIYASTDNKYDVHPFLILGDKSWTCIGFQSGGKGYKFRIITKNPGQESANIASDPYGKVGFTSIQWWYGFLANKPDWMVLIKTVAPA